MQNAPALPLHSSPEPPINTTLGHAGHGAPVTLKWVRGIFNLIFIVLLISFSFFGLAQAAPTGADFLNRDVKIPARPKRILSLSPATTEILFLLGLEKNIVGVTSDCNFPAQALKKPKIGKFGFIDLEKVVSLKPDIIFATSDMNKQLDVLKNYKVPLIALNTTNLNSVLENVELIGKLTSRQRQAKKLRMALL